MFRDALVPLLTVVLGLATLQDARGQDEDTPIVSPTGYFEGSAQFAADYYKNLKHLSMQVKSKSDYWFVVSRNGELHGEGEAKYDFSFGVDWGMATSMGISIMNVMGLKLDPKVSIELDPKTASHKFYLTGSIKKGEPPTMTLNISLIPPNDPTTAKRTDGKKAEPPKLALNLVGTLTGSLTGRAKYEIKNEATGSERASADADVGGMASVSTIMQTIKVDPNPPLGTDQLSLEVKKRSPYGPYYVEFKYDGEGTDANTGVVVNAVAVQKMDFERERWLAELVGRLGPPGGRGGVGPPGEPGGVGPPGGRGGKDPPREPGETGLRGDSGPFILAGEVTVAVGSKTTVRFNAPFQVLQSSCPQGKGPQCWKATDNYAVVLTLGEGAPKGLTFTWGHKTSEGFTVLVAEANNRKEGEPRVFPSVQPVRVTIDWVATQITRP